MYPRAEEDGIDPEFLAALPEDIRLELLNQQRRDRDRRRREQERAAAAAAAASTAPAAPVEMDLASLLATFPPDVREDVLLTYDESVLATLPPAIMAEAQVSAGSKDILDMVYELKPNPGTLNPKLQP